MHSVVVQMPSIMETDRSNEARRWLEHVRAVTGWSWNRMAEEATIQPSTITGFIKNNGRVKSMNLSTLDKIGAAVGIDPFSYKSSPFGAFAESEAAPYEPLEARDTWMDAAIRAVIGNSANRHPWVLKTDALNASGYLSGDHVIVDEGARPHDTDIVCAQIYDWQQDKTETVFRLYQKPWLVVHTNLAKPIKPLVVDDSNVVIKGPVIAQFRGRDSLH